MKNISITKENLQNAYDDASEDVQKVLKNLCPDEFKDEYEYSDNKIFAFIFSSNINVIHRIRGGKYDIVCLNRPAFAQSGRGVFKTGQKAVEFLLNEGMELKIFNSREDFFTWALKMIK